MRESESNNFANSEHQTIELGEKQTGISNKEDGQNSPFMEDNDYSKDMNDSVGINGIEGDQAGKITLLSHVDMV